MTQASSASSAPPAASRRRLHHVRPSLELMRSLQGEAQTGTDIALDVYCHRNPLLREFFWLRLRFLTWMLRRFGRGRANALDFGGGSGVFLPTLATGFDRVRLIDLHTEQARALCEAMGIDNVECVSDDIATFDFEAGSFDAIVAADVLEHFREHDLPLTKIHRWLADDGLLFTSLPTENVFYRGLRVVFRKQKPPDHYHSARDVENALRRAGFRKRFGIYHPLVAPLFPLFRISAWEKAREG